MSFRIEICGVMGSGKTSLALALRDEFLSDDGIVLDEYKKVLFWEECWSRAGVYEFERDISFLLHHHYLVTKARQGVICDFSFLDDLAYSKLLRNSADIGIFESVYNRLETQRPRPTLVLHLECSISTVIKRIRKRGRIEESEISISFLENLTSSINSILSQFRAKNAGVDVLTIDTEQFDLRIKDHRATIFSIIEPAIRRIFP